MPNKHNGTRSLQSSSVEADTIRFPTKPNDVSRVCEENRYAPRSSERDAAERNKLVYYFEVSSKYDLADDAMSEKRCRCGRNL